MPEGRPPAYGVGAVSLMHGIDAQEAGLAPGIGPAPLADGHGDGTSPGVAAQPLAVTAALAQVVEMGDGDRRQPRKLLLAK